MSTFNLADYATPIEGRGTWRFPGTTHAYTTESAEAVVEACLLLDVPVSPVVTSQAWLKVVRLAAGQRPRRWKLWGKR